MSFDFSTIKWGWVVIGTIVAAVVSIVLSLVIQFGYGLVIGFQLRGAPPQEMLIEAFTSTPFLILDVITTIIGAVVGCPAVGGQSPVGRPCCRYSDGGTRTCGRSLAGES